MKTDALFRTTVNVDGFTYSVSYRPDGVVVYKDVPTGQYFRRMWIWDSRRSVVPKADSPILRVLALADAKRPEGVWPRYESRRRGLLGRNGAGRFVRIA